MAFELSYGALTVELKIHDKILSKEAINYYFLFKMYN